MLTLCTQIQNYTGVSTQAIKEKNEKKKKNPKQTVVQACLRWKS